MHSPEKPKRGAEFKQLMKLAKPTLAESLIFKQRQIESLTSENDRIVIESKQCHSTNDELVSERFRLQAKVEELREELEVAHVRAASDKQSMFNFRAQIRMLGRQVTRWEAVATLVDTIQELHDDE